MNSCETCRHWQEFPARNPITRWGECGMVVIDDGSGDSRAYLAGEGNQALTTRSDFGCTGYEPKGHP